METNSIMVMIDEEIARLGQVRQILQSLGPDQVLLAAADTTAEAVQVAGSPVRHVSRRGIATGSRGSRRATTSALPRALGATVPQGLVVVSPAARAVVHPPVRQEQPSPGVPAHKLDTLLAAFAGSQQTAPA